MFPLLLSSRCLNYNILFQSRLCFSPYSELQNKSFIECDHYVYIPPCSTLTVPTFTLLNVDFESPFHTSIDGNMTGTVLAEVVSAHVGERHDPNILHRRSMEDDTCIAQFEDIPGLFLGVYDGHGGASAASLVGQLLHRYFLEELLHEHVEELHAHSQDVQSAFVRAYEKMDTALLMKRCLRVGATAVTCFVRRVDGVGRVLTTANCGDSRAVLSRAGRPVRLSVDHRPIDEPERNRVEKAGGFVTCARVNGILNVSRAFGDHVMKSLVVSTPDVNEVVLGDMDDFVVLACDGLWDFVDEASVISIAQDGFDRGLNADEVAGELVNEALERKSTDNVSVMVVQFDEDDE